MLEQIVARKRRELEETKRIRPLGQLLDSLPESPVIPLSGALDGGGLNIIAEIKYHSPSRGEFSCRLSPCSLAEAYLENGAAALSILTESHFFNGSLDYLEEVRRDQDDAVLLRKDFIVDPYQVPESRAAGASAFLLIAAILDRARLRELIELGASHSLEPLVEVHTARELDVALESGARLIGVNNRDLTTFEVDLQTSFDLARRVEGEPGLVLVSESGLKERSPLLELRAAGFRGFLIGSHFMDSEDPGRALRELLEG